MTTHDHDHVRVSETDQLQGAKFLTRYAELVVGDKPPRTDDAQRGLWRLQALEPTEGVIFCVCQQTPATQLLTTNQALLKAQHVLRFYPQLPKSR